MSGQLNNKVALVTGGSRGIGRAIVDRFRQEGARVITCGRGKRPDDLDTEIEWQRADVSSINDVQALAAFIAQTSDRLDILVNNAGIQIEKTLLESSDEDLGFVFLAGPMGPEPVAIMEHPSGVNINFILNADSGIADNILMDVPERHPGYTHMALDVTDIKAIQATLMLRSANIALVRSRSSPVLKNNKS